MAEAGAGGGWAAWAEKARKNLEEQAKGAYEKVQDTAQGGDVELGETATQWASWARSSAEKAREGISKSAGEQAKVGWAEMASTIGKVAEGASKGAAGLSESAKLAQQKAASAAGAAKEGLAKAGSGIGGTLGGLSQMAMSPQKLLQFAGLFMAGFMVTSLSFSFLPLLPVSPQKFSLLFALGSLMMLGSVAFLKGPKAFASIAMQKEKLPFTASYVVGLIGTFWATLVARSYLFTAIFALMQAGGLVYFLASFVPGGQALLNNCGRLFRTCASKLMGR